MEQPTKQQRLRRIRDIREEMRLRYADDADLWDVWVSVDVALACKEAALMDEIDAVLMETHE